MHKKDSRLRRARKTRSHIRRLGVQRLSVYRTPRHIYAQIIDDAKGVVVASASTLDAKIAANLKTRGNVAAAQEVGKHIAARAKEAGVTRVAFDRSGFKYHGRVKALADAARKEGLGF